MGRWACQSEGHKQDKVYWASFGGGVGKDPGGNDLEAGDSCLDICVFPVPVTLHLEARSW